MSGAKELRTYLPDGLYAVSYRDIEASFEVKCGIVVRIAPVLLKRFHYFEQIAVLVRSAHPEPPGPMAFVGKEVAMLDRKTGTLHAPGSTHLYTQCGLGPLDYVSVGPTFVLFRQSNDVCPLCWESL
jgi:hypothetical protein